MALRYAGATKKNIVAAFPGMHVSPAKHSYAWLPRKCDYRTDRQTDTRQSDPYTSAAMLRMRHNNDFAGSGAGDSGGFSANQILPTQAVTSRWKFL